MFVLSDDELGERGVTGHSINAKPLKESPSRLPYALRQQL